MEARTFGQKLKEEMEVARGQSNWRRGLARQVAERTGQDAEYIRRAIYKWVDGGVEPTEASRRAITDTLGLEPGSLDSDDEEESLNAALLREMREARERLSRVEQMLGEKVA